MLHAPGKMVPSIVVVLEKYLPDEEQQILVAFQQLIIKYITTVRSKEEIKLSSNTLNNEPQKSNTDNKMADTVETNAEETSGTSESESQKSNEGSKMDDNTVETKDGEGDKEEGTANTTGTEQVDNDPAMLLSKLRSNLPIVKAIVLKPKKDQ